MRGKTGYFRKHMREEVTLNTQEAEQGPLVAGETH